jgi:multidrug transporter EmrE-like cation transporter
MSLETIVKLSFVEVFGDLNARWYAQTNNIVYLAGGVLGYGGVLFYLIESLRTHNVLYVNGMWDGISTIVESVAAFVILGDRLKKPEQYIGLGLIIAGLLLLREHV